MPECIRERVCVPGPIGVLAGELAYGSGASLGAVLLLCPHPYMGGRMDLPLLQTIASTLAKQGLTTLRFDYRGVGESEGTPPDISASMDQFWKTGTAPEDPHMIEDALAARDWISTQVHSPIALAGYSFGAFVSTQICDATTPAMALIAPTIAKHNYADFDNPQTPTLIVFGEGDFATAEDEVHAWSARLTGPTTLTHVQGADHFFRKSAAQVAKTCADFLVASFNGAPAHGATL